MVGMLSRTETSSDWMLTKLYKDMGPSLLRVLEECGNRYLEKPDMCPLEFKQHRHCGLTLTWRNSEDKRLAGVVLLAV